MTPVLNWIKAHLLIVIMCLISVIVLPVVIFASSSWNAKIAKQIADRVSAQNGKISKASSTQVVVKPLVPGAPAIEDNMTVNQKMVDEYRAVREQIRADATELEQWVVKVNRSGKEGQLVPGLLPEPSRSEMNELPFRIHNAFLRAHEELLKRTGAGMPPAPDLVQEQLVEFDRNYRRTQFNVDPQTMLSESEQTKLAEAMTARRLAIYAQAAQEYSVYADMSVLNLDPWQDQKAPDKFRWYEWQHTYWLNSDILAAITKANTVDGERGTITGQTSSVVKRIVSIIPERLYPPSLTEASLKPMNVPGGEASDPAGGKTAGGDDFGPSVMPVGGADFGPSDGGGPPPGTSMSKFGRFESAPADFSPGGGGGAPKPAADPSAYADPGQPFAPTFAESISGRFGRTGLYDMRRVNVKLIVDSSRLQELFDAFHSTNFMSVVGFRTQPLEVSGDLAQGFYYGRDPVIEVELNIETLWLRDWTVNLMPPPVRQYFGIVEKTPEG